MGASKQHFIEEREWMVVMSDRDYCSIPFEMRQRFKTERAQYPDQHKELMESDPVYQGLYRNYRKSKKELEDYKYDKRNA